MKSKDSDIKNALPSKKWLTLLEVVTCLKEKYDIQASKRDVVHLVSIGKVDGYVFINREMCCDLLNTEKTVFCGRGTLNNFISVLPRDAIKLEIAGYAEIGVAKNPRCVNGKIIADFEFLRFDEEYKEASKIFEHAPEKFECYLDKNISVEPDDLLIEATGFQRLMEENNTQSFINTNTSSLPQKRVKIVNGDSLDIKRENTYLRLIYALSSALIKGCSEQPYKDSQRIILELEKNIKNVPNIPISVRKLGDYLHLGRELSINVLDEKK